MAKMWMMMAPNSSALEVLFERYLERKITLRELLGAFCSEDFNVSDELFAHAAQRQNGLFARLVSETPYPGLESVYLPLVFRVAKLVDNATLRASAGPVRTFIAGANGYQGISVEASELLERLA